MREYNRISVKEGYNEFEYPDDHELSGGSYSGEIIDGMRHGEGELTMPSGDKFIARFENDDAVFGEYLFLSEKPQRKKFCGDIYEGEFANSTFNGQGTYHYLSVNHYSRGDRYEGQWKEGKRHGMGVYYYANGETEEGIWTNGWIVGKGKLTFSDGDYYEGDLDHGVMDGDGIYYWDDGEKYVGGYHQGKRTGTGCYTHSDGTITEGEFIDGEIDGKQIGNVENKCTAHTIESLLDYSMTLKEKVSNQRPFVPDQIIFEAALFNALKESGQAVITDYIPAGTSQRWDGYIPSFPRTVIETLVGKGHKEAIARMTKWRNMVAHSLIPEQNVFVYIRFKPIDLFDEPTMLEEKAEKLGVVLLNLHYPKSAKEMKQTANIAAQKIKSIRKSKLTTKEIDVEKCQIPNWQRQPGDNPALLSSIEENGILEPINVVQEADGSYTVIDGGSRLFIAKKIGLKTIPALQLGTNLPEFWDTINDDTDFDVRKMLKPDLLALLSLIEEAAVRDVINHEFVQLTKEYEETHYTSCGLRVGRLLELLIYGLSSAWSVPLNEPRLNGLVMIDDRTAELKSIFLDYCDITDEGKRKKKFTEIQKKLNKIMEQIMSLQLEVQNTDLSDLQTMPRNTGAILRDIKRKYSYMEIVRMEFDGKALEDMVHGIMKIRNNAAHADINLQKRELNKKDTEEMITKIRQLMAKLTIIGIAIENEKN